jgi:hypothetical protein
MRRGKLAEIYRQELKNLNSIVLPEVSFSNESVWHVYCVRVLNGLREELIQYLNEAKVGTNIHYPEPLHLQNCYQDLGYKLGDFPITESYSKEILSLPLSWYHTEEEIYRVSKLIKEFFRR